MQWLTLPGIKGITKNHGKALWLDGISHRTNNC